jgi:large subunit ribosomal protein L15
MAYLSNLTGIGKKKSKRLGRGYGSGKGAKSTRGITRHQKARVDTPLHFEGGQGRLVKKYPLLRGKGKNNSHRAVVFPVAVEKLEILRDNDVVTVAGLLEAKIITKSDTRCVIKIVGKGTLSKKLTVKLPITQSAKAVIEKAGGTVETHASNNR